MTIIKLQQQSEQFQLICRPCILEQDYMIWHSSSLTVEICDLGKLQCSQNDLSEGQNEVCPSQKLKTLQWLPVALRIKFKPSNLFSSPVWSGLCPFPAWSSGTLSLLLYNSKHPEFLSGPSRAGLLPLSHTPRASQMSPFMTCIPCTRHVLCLLTP